jgi:hypothetical protein
MAGIMRFSFRCIRWSLIGLRIIVPWILRAAWFTLRLAATALVSLWVGVPNATRRIADAWLGRATLAGFPTEYDTYLYHAVCFVAFLTIVLGWIVLAFLTVFLIRLLFHLPLL